MTGPRKITSERERVTCFLCRRRRPPEKMTGTRCSDRESCARAMGPARQRGRSDRSGEGRERGEARRVGEPMTAPTGRPLGRPRSAKHGTRSRYVAGCRCDPCSEANRVYQREWMRADFQRNPEKYRERGKLRWVDRAVDRVLTEERGSA